MAKISKEEQARRDGMAYAYRHIKQDGIEAFEEEMKRRKIDGDMPIAVDMKACEQWMENMRRHTVSRMQLLFYYIVRDEFGFGKSRLLRMKERFDSYTESLLGGFVEWEDIQEQVAEETGVYVALEALGVVNMPRTV